MTKEIKKQAGQNSQDTTWASTPGKQGQAGQNKPGLGKQASSQENKGQINKQGDMNTVGKKPFEKNEKK